MPEDSLSKFSYYFLGYKEGQPEATQGTGFFMNIKGIKTLVTANHCLTGCMYNKPREPRADKMTLFYQNDKGEKNFKMLSFNIKNIVDTAVCREYYIYPDVIKYNIKDTNRVYELNKSLLIKDTIANYEEVVIFGYPLGKYESNGAINLPAVTKFKTELYEIDYSPYLRGENGVILKDVANYRIYPLDKKITENLHGFSGAPVFIKRTRDSKYLLLGVFIAMSVKENLLFIAKPESVLKIIN